MSLEHVWNSLNASFQELTGSFADAVMPAARVVHVGDRNLAARGNWLAALYPVTVSVKYNELDTTLLSSASGDFQLFILHGDDTDRMSKIIRRNSEVLAGKIKIALCSRSYPPDRARLLNSGFDDVFDLRMDPVEAFARINAMQRRRTMAMRSQISEINNVLLEEIHQYTKQRLTHREYEVLAKLVSKRGAPVSFSELSRSKNKRIPPMGRQALQVFICRLRKKLKPGIHINCNFDGGYFFARSA
ncbi:MAG: hypothetical protein RIQ46_2003 [Pseudomonadota bacterium]